MNPKKGALNNLIFYKIVYFVFQSSKNTSPTLYCAKLCSCLFILDHICSLPFFSFKNNFVLRNQYTYSVLYRWVYPRLYIFSFSRNQNKR